MTLRFEGERAVNALWYVAGMVTPYLAYVGWWAGSRAATSARLNFRPVVHHSEAREVEAVSVVLARRFVRLRLPGHRVIYVRSTVPTLGDPGYRVLVSLSDAVAAEVSR